MVPKIKKVSKRAPRRRPTPIATSRTEAKEGGKPPPGLGGLGGSDWKGEEFGGSEEKKRALHADPVGRRILQELDKLM